MSERQARERQAEIDALYADLADGRDVAKTSSERYHHLRERLDVLEAEDAEALRRRLASSGPLKLGEVDDAIAEARALIEKHGGTR